MIVNKLCIKLKKIRKKISKINSGKTKNLNNGS